MSATLDSTPEIAPAADHAPQPTPPAPKGEPTHVVYYGIAAEKFKAGASPFRYVTVTMARGRRFAPDHAEAIASCLNDMVLQSHRSQLCLILLCLSAAQETEVTP